jgi:hypothetical protein
MTPINLCFDSMNYQFESESHCDSLESVISSSKRIFRDHNPIFVVIVEWSSNSADRYQANFHTNQAKSSHQVVRIPYCFNLIVHLTETRNLRFVFSQSVV